MNTKKFILGGLLAFVIALGFMAVPPDAGAQGIAVWSGLADTTVGGSGAGGTNNIAANTTNATAVRLDFPRTENAVLAVSFKLVGAGTSPVEFTLVPGWETGYGTNNLTVQHKWNVTANGTTGVAAFTNINLLGYPYLWAVTNGHNNANAVTNLRFQVGFKR